ncbi:MAG TPA: beta-propeller fold lactonase family protein, partial [Leptospiraceae bacterium]|nr:beta-propeller fold lactonase family protein [Leptospiraceae bacterium]
NPGKIDAFTVNSSTGALTQVAGAPYTTGNDNISVAVDPAGKFVFGANYFTTNVFSFVINTATGALSAAPGSPYAAGSAPGYVYSEPLGRFVYVANSGDAVGTAAISGYSLNSTTGALTALGGSPFAAGANPIAFYSDPSGKFLYSVNTGSNNISGFAVNSSTGALTPVPGSPFSTGAGSSPFSIVMISY